MSYGWLGHRPELPLDRVRGVPIDPGLPTRREEFTRAAEVLGAGEGRWVLDAGAGYIPMWHIMPYVLAKQGWEVVALDNDRRSEDMPPATRVIRVVEDMGHLQPRPFYDAIVCISVLEHLDWSEVRERVVPAFVGVSKPGAQLFVTTDEVDPGLLAETFGAFYEVGEFVENPVGLCHLRPRVSFLEGHLK